MERPPRGAIDNQATGWRARPSGAALYTLKDQLRRAALSIALNISSEGIGKSSMPDRLRFFEIAMGSIRECQAITELEQDSFTAAQRDLLDHVAASTYKLIRNSRL